MLNRVKVQLYLKHLCYPETKLYSRFERMGAPKKLYSNNYESAFWEAQSFIIAAEAISKKARSVLLKEIGTSIYPEKSLGLELAKDVKSCLCL